MISAIKRTTGGGVQTFAIVWFGQVISFIGSGLTSFALGVWVYQTTGSITRFALISLFTTLPGVVLGPFAGALVDRWDRRRAMILSDAGAGLSTLAIILLLLIGRLEVGHTLGLDHQDENFNNANLGTCMDYTNDPGTNQHPNAHDYEQLELIYAHLDSTTTVGNMPAAMANGDFHSQSEWGQMIRTSSDGRASLYVRDFGGGHQVFTFVFWAK
jgi:hypothetical protein